MLNKEFTSVTVIIPHKNDSKVISRAIDSICQQSFKPQQILVIDDWSDEDQKNLLNNIILKYKETLPIAWVPSSGRGLSAARNTGILLAENELVAFLDCDDEWRFDKLALQVSGFDIKNSAIHSWCIDVYPDKRDLLLKPNSNYSQEKLVKGIYSVTGSSSSIILTRKLALKVGGFNEKLEAGEDVDMWVRISACGELKCIDEPLVRVHRRDTGAQQNLRFNPDIKITAHKEMLLSWIEKGIIDKKFARNVLAIRLFSITSEFSRNSGKYSALKFLSKYIIYFSKIYSKKFFFIACVQFFLRYLIRLK